MSNASQSNMKSSNASVYVLFNLKFSEFVEDLIYICPEVEDLKTFRVALKMTTFANVKGAQKIFNESLVQPFGAQIEARDEEFFLKEGYSEFGCDFNIISNLKKIWKKLDVDNKNMIWKYFQILTLISNKCQISKSI